MEESGRERAGLEARIADLQQRVHAMELLQVPLPGVYRLPFTVYRLPSTVCLPSTVRLLPPPRSYPSGV
eukprot:349590-Rhodomonas_salina.1